MIGLETFFEAMAKPRHPQHGEVVDWYDARFDPSDIGVEIIRERVAKLARR